MGVVMEHGRGTAEKAWSRRVASLARVQPTCPPAAAETPPFAVSLVVFHPTDPLLLPNFIILLFFLSPFLLGFYFLVSLFPR
jgi:hypothetical protein